MRRVMNAVIVGCACLVAGCDTDDPKTATNLANLEKRVEDLEKTVAAHDTRIAHTKRNPSSTTIALSKASSGGGNACDTAKVLDYRVGNAHQMHVRWDIDADCTLFGSRLELRFEAVNGQFPFASQNVPARGGNRFVQERIKPSSDVAQGIYKYTVWLVPAVGAPKQLLDPELEVEPPPVVVTPK